MNTALRRNLFPINYYQILPKQAKKFPHNFLYVPALITCIALSDNIKFNTSLEELESPLNPTSAITSTSSQIKLQSYTEINSIKKLVSLIKKWYQRMKDTLVLLFRGSEIVLLSLPLCTVLGPLSYLESFTESFNTKFFLNLTWNYTLFSIQTLGPAFVKLGQWASTRRDLFPKEICNRLALLQRHVRTHSWKKTHETLVESFGSNYTQELLITSNSPILGSGSVAQVYQAYLLNHGPVAVKVLHPNIASLVSRDLYLIKIAAEFLNFILPQDIAKCFNLPTAAKNFSNVLSSQVDLQIEAENLKIFQENFQKEESGNIHFPSPIDKWVTKQVLVEDLVIDSKSISCFLNHPNKAKLAQPLFNAFLKMLFIDNFFHCDLHPGNILVSDFESTNNEKGGKINVVISNNPKLTFLDAGLATKLSSVDYQNLKDLFLAIVLDDGETAGTLMITRAKYENPNKQPQPDEIEAFSNGIKSIVSEFHSQKSNGLTLGSIKIGQLLTQVLELCNKYRVEMDPVMINVVISTLVLEGLGRSLDPDLDLMECAIPFLVQASLA